MCRQLISTFLVSLLSLCCSCGSTVRVTTWNLEWFPNGTPKEAPPDKQQARITAAAGVLRSLKPDIILLQEVKDWDACTRLAEAIQPHAYQVAVCSRFKEGAAIGKQQVAIIATESAQAAWSEPWKSMEGVDPPRGFAFAWFRIRGADVGVYSVHLKSNLVMHGDKAAETAKNIRKREVAGLQVVKHIHDIVELAMPNVHAMIVGGDFNTDRDEFGNEGTLKTLENAGFANCMAKLPIAQRITHPGSHGYPDATFDYVFVRNASLGLPQISQTNASDHLPVTCDVSISATKIPSALPQASAGAPLFVTVTAPVTVDIPYGKTVIPRGARLRIVSRSNDSVVVEFLDGKYPVPISSTDLTGR